MALYTTPEENAANPPETWQVVKVADRRWALKDATGTTLSAYSTRCEAVAAREDSFYTRLWDQERRWMTGETPAGWKPYAECVAERQRIAEQWAS